MYKKSLPGQGDGLIAHLWGPGLWVSISALSLTVPVNLDESLNLLDPFWYKMW